MDLVFTILGWIALGVISAYLLAIVGKIIFDTEVFNLTHNTRDWTFEDWREFYLKKVKEDKQ